jgi:hypothetical protein
LSSIAMSNSREFILLVFISEPLQSLVVIWWSLTIDSPKPNTN